MDAGLVAGLIALGAATGLLAGLLGIGGGILTVPFLTFYFSLRGFPIAAAGTVGYVRAGAGAPGLPPGTLGFIYLPALVVIALASVVVAPLGARAAHSLGVKPMKRIFALLLLSLASYMLYKGLRAA